MAFKHPDMEITAGQNLHVKKLLMILKNIVFHNSVWMLLMWLNIWKNPTLTSKHNTCHACLLKSTIISSKKSPRKQGVRFLGNTSRYPSHKPRPIAGCSRPSLCCWWLWITITTSHTSPASVNKPSNSNNNSIVSAPSALSALCGASQLPSCCILLFVFCNSAVVTKPCYDPCCSSLSLSPTERPLCM